MSGHPPTDQQAYAIELGHSGRHVVLQAGAGAGKTSTLVMIAEHEPDKRCAFNAFNASIKDDAVKKFPSNTEAKTLHGRAHTAVVKGTPFINRLGGGKRRMSPFDMAKALGARDLFLATPYGAKRLSSGFLASLAGKTIDNFCRSADVMPSPWHVPRQDGLDEPTADGRRGPVMSEVANEVAALAKKLWADIISPTGVLPFDHGHYLKMWQLSDPKINADIVFVDEAQDLNGCMASIAEAQMGHAQLIVVGDSQQAIYGWNGAIDALDKFGIEDVAWLTQSFRFGPAVAEVANQVLEQLGAQLRLTGFEPRESVVTTVRDGQFTLLGRTNALIVSNALRDIQDGRKVHIVGGAKDVISFAEAAAKLKAGQTTWHHDLACFSTWGEAQDYAENDPMGEDLKLLVRLVDQYGADTLCSVLKNQCPEDAAESLYSTAHKAKGREWDRVCIGSDFTDPEKREIAPEEKRLTYVAVTRAMQELDVADVPLLNQKKETV